MKGQTSMKTYLWLEDRKGKSGYIFWETFMKQLWPEVLVESKKNNSELVNEIVVHDGEMIEYETMSDMKKHEVELDVDKYKLHKAMD
jgi:hypothetical protein